MRAMGWLLATWVMFFMAGCGGGGSEPDDNQGSDPGKIVVPPLCAANPKACV